jgi:TRAP-type C4-dicarboxylate transport system permease small subunit
MGINAALLWLDRNLEKLIISTSMLALAAIVVVAVVQRFVFNYQTPWSGSIPIYLFLWVTWIGAAHNVRTRSQLRFDELRSRLPHTGQFLCLLLDTFLWLLVGAIVIYFTVQQTELVYRNFAVVQGTESLQQWWFYLATPLGWSLVVLRALQNLWEDVQTYRRGEPFNNTTSLFTAD